MKRMFALSGITLVGMETWLLPNQAKADGEHKCHSEVAGSEFKWNCSSVDLCRMIVVLTNPPLVITYCA